MSILDDLRDTIGDDATERLIAEFGGTRVYIPSSLTVDSEVVKREFADLVADGSTCMNAYRTIASEHNVSARTVRRLISY